MSLKEYHPFDCDVEETGAYQYSTGERYSSIVANARLVDLAIEAIDWTGQRVLDVGCGDGVFTMELFRRGKLSHITGIDLSSNAITAATARVRNADATFAVCSGAQLPFDRDSFDVVQFRGVLHHMDDPRLAIAEALRVARRVIILEPNGWNPVLKCIEKLSPYHRQHHEQSYFSTRINEWVESQGGTVARKKWAGLVPFFCPTGLAKVFKAIEPVIESIPVLRQFSCGTYVAVAERVDSIRIPTTVRDVRESRAA